MDFSNPLRTRAILYIYKTKSKFMQEYVNTRHAEVSARFYYAQDKSGDVGAFPPTVEICIAKPDGSAQ